MEIKISKSYKDGQERKEPLKRMNKDEESTHDNVLVLNGDRTNNPGYFNQEPFLRYMQRLDCKIPKHIITFDEKYLRHCLELVYANAMSRTSCTNVPEYLSSQISTYFKETSSLNFRSEIENYFPLQAGIIENGTISTITRSKGGVSLRKSPLFGQSFNDETGYLTEDTVSTSSRLSINSLQRPDTKMTPFENGRFNFDPQVSSSHTLSNRSSFSLFGNINRGMLQCTWKAGLPHFIFNLDDHNEIYVANIIKSETPSDNGFDYIYTFHTNEEYLVGKMRVSTSLKLCSNNSQIKETEFVLFGQEERDIREGQTSISRNSRKTKRLSNMMSDIFKTGHSVKERPSLRYGLTNENPLTDLYTDFPPNLELAAIIVKEHVCVNRLESEVGGWGLKFLKKNELKDPDYLTDPSLSSCDCISSTNILIPADIHGGARDRTGGPSGLVDRWQRDGKCDCGGWDIGCPITVLDSERSIEGNFSQTDIQVAGLRDSVPVMKILNIRDGLYVIYFKSNLSALQSLSIAMSILHSQNVQCNP